MRVMVAFLGGKKDKSRKKYDINRNINMNNYNNVFNNEKKVIYASVVKNENNNINIKNIKHDIIKEKAINNIEELVNKNNYTRNSNVKKISVKEKYKVNTNYFRLSYFFNLILVIIPLLIIVFSNSNLASSILIRFSTNFRQAQNTTFKMADLVKLYSIYNANNYIVKNENQDTIQKSEMTSEEEIIDAEANIEDVQAFFANDKVNVEITENSSSIQRVTIGNTKILNYSSKRDIDYEGLLNSDVVLTKKSDKILLYNTHTSESYTNSDEYKFEYTGTMRTTNADFNMLAIAKKLNENLMSKGFLSVQNTTPHDYGTYTSAYAKSRITVQNALNSMSGAGIIIDVHRDASSNLEFRPVANIKGVQVAQLMFVVGVGSSSMPNDKWQDNLKLALKLQQIADKVYPGLFRPMIIRNSVYNQDLNKYALLIEFGATGNTIEEVKLSTRCMTNLLNIIYKD